MEAALVVFALDVASSFAAKIIENLAEEVLEVLEGAVDAERVADEF